MEMVIRYFFRFYFWSCCSIFWFFIRVNVVWVVGYIVYSVVKGFRNKRRG